MYTMDSISAYFHDIRKSQPLSKAAEQEIARRIQAGDEKALDELVIANTEFVVTVARTFLGRGLELGDLISEGNIGLIQAAKRFDPDMGFRFITFAVHYIRQRILYALSQNRAIRLPMNVLGSVAQLNRAIETFEGLENRKPTEAELHKLTGISVGEIRTFLRASARLASINKPVGDDEDSELSDLLEDNESSATDAGLRQSDLEIDVKITLKRVLSPKEIRVVSGSYGIGEDTKSDEEIGNELGVGPERVRQLREKSISKLRKDSEAIKTLMSYLA